LEFDVGLLLIIQRYLTPLPLIAAVLPLIAGHAVPRPQLSVARFCLFSGQQPPRFDILLSVALVL